MHLGFVSRMFEKQPAAYLLLEVWDTSQQEQSHCGVIIPVKMNLTQIPKFICSRSPSCPSPCPHIPIIHHASINTVRGNLKRCAVFWRVGDACILGRSCLQEGPFPHSEVMLGSGSVRLVVAHVIMTKEWLMAGLCPDVSVPRFFWL